MVVNGTSIVRSYFHIASENFRLRSGFRPFALVNAMLCRLPRYVAAESQQDEVFWKPAF